MFLIEKKPRFQNITFIYDSVKPTSYIGVPSGSSYYNNIPQITGTTADKINATNPGIVTQVDLRIKKVSGVVQYYSATGWQDQETWVVATGTDSWNYTTNI